MVETELKMKMYLGDRVRFFSDLHDDWLRGEILDITLEKSSGGTRFEPYVTIALNLRNYQQDGTYDSDVMRFRARDEDLERKQFRVTFSDYARAA
jgi:hypothetical protein